MPRRHAARAPTRRASRGRLRGLQKMRTLLNLGACRDDGTGNSVLDMKMSDQVMKIIDKERALRQELEELKRKKK